jgi:hypothetical protein
MRLHPSLLCLGLAASLLLPSCVDEPLAATSSPARLVVAWDPLACGPPHRVVMELEGEAGGSWSAAAPCNLGGLAIDVSHHGGYRGRLYAMAPDASSRSVVAIELIIDQPIVHCHVATPR